VVSWSESVLGQRFATAFLISSAEKIERMYVTDLSTPVVGAAAAAAAAGVLLHFLGGRTGMSTLSSGWLCSDSLEADEDSE
jgi:hypothetical protein